MKVQIVTLHGLGCRKVRQLPADRKVVRNFRSHAVFADVETMARYVHLAGEESKPAKLVPRPLPGPGACVSPTGPGESGEKLD